MDVAIRMVDGRAVEDAFGFGLAPQRFRNDLEYERGHVAAIGATWREGKRALDAIRAQNRGSKVTAYLMEASMRIASILVLAAVASLSAAPAFAQEAVDRYRLERAP